MLKRHRKEGVYTIESDQTYRDDLHGEIPETVLEFVDGALRLGTPYSQLAQQEKTLQREAAVRSVIDFVQQNPDCQMQDILSGLGMSKKTVLNALKATELISPAGEGVKGDPYTYRVSIPEENTETGPMDVASA
jgi:hypothetical protein